MGNSRDWQGGYLTIWLFVTFIATGLVAWAVRSAPRWFPFSFVPALLAGLVAVGAVLDPHGTLFVITSVVFICLTWIGWLLFTARPGRSFLPSAVQT